MSTSSNLADGMKPACHPFLAATIRSLGWRIEASQLACIDSQMRAELQTGNTPKVSLRLSLEKTGHHDVLKRIV